MARFLLLHGYGGVGADHWLVWLSGELRARGHVARIRKLPSPMAPDLDAWMTSMHGRLRALGDAGAPAGGATEAASASPAVEGALDESGDPSGELVVVAHSMGGLLWLQHAQETEDGPDGRYPFAVADRVVLVTPPRLPEHIARTRFHDLDVTRVDPARVARHTRVVISGNDPYWPGGGAVAGIADPLGLPVDHIGDHRHVEPADGYGPWPSMLTWCLGDAETITA